MPQSAVASPTPDHALFYEAKLGRVRGPADVGELGTIG